MVTCAVCLSEMCVSIRLLAENHTVAENECIPLNRISIFYELSIVDIWGPTDGTDFLEFSKAGGCYTPPTPPLMCAPDYVEVFSISDHCLFLNYLRNQC